MPMAHVRGALVAGLVQLLQVVGVDPPHVAHHVGEQFALRVVAGEVGHHVHAGKTPAVHRETVDLVLGEVQLQRHAVEAAALLDLLEETVDVVLAQRHHHAQLRQHRLHVLDLLGYHLEPERGHVVGQQHAVAIVDEAARRRQHARLDPVVHRAGDELVVPRHLQVDVARNQRAQPQQDQRKAHQRAAPEQCAFAALILDRASPLHQCAPRMPDMSAPSSRKVRLCFVIPAKTGVRRLQVIEHSGAGFQLAQE